MQKPLDEKAKDARITGALITGIGVQGTKVLSSTNMDGQAGQLNCCARSLAWYANPLAPSSLIGVEVDGFTKVLSHGKAYS